VKAHAGAAAKEGQGDCRIQQHVPQKSIKRRRKLGLQSGEPVQRGQGRFGTTLTGHQGRRAGNLISRKRRYTVDADLRMSFLLTDLPADGDLGCLESGS